MATWNAAYLASPADSDSPEYGAGKIRNLKDEITERIKNEHFTYLADGTSGTAALDWTHREGSAVAYYQASAPTNRPNAATPLDSNDDGRLWIDSDDGTLDYWDGSAWQSFPYLAAAATGTISAVWTFSATPLMDAIDEVTGDTGVTIDGVLLKDNAVTASGGVTATLTGMADSLDASGSIVLTPKVVEIGYWNMDGTASVSVAHGLTLSKIISVTAIIRDDDDTFHYPVGSFGTGILQAYISSINATDVSITRLGSGTFDALTFDAATYNRGWVTIWYDGA